LFSSHKRSKSMLDNLVDLPPAEFTRQRTSNKSLLDVYRAT